MARDPFGKELAAGDKVWLYYDGRERVASIYRVEERRSGRARLLVSIPGVDNPRRQDGLVSVDAERCHLAEKAGASRGP